VYHLGMSQKVKIKIPEDLSPSELSDSLESIIKAIKDHHLDHEDILKEYREGNPATKKMVNFIDESWEQMEKNLIQQISDVLVKS